MTNLFKLDLHTHSNLSHDGGISPKEYENLLFNGTLDYVAITDHNEIDTALELNNRFGDRIIVGEEIMSREGEVIGLFLNKLIKPGLSLLDSIREIKNQQGLVYIPHPRDFYRSGIGMNKLKEIIAEVDIVEVYNQRSFETWVNGGAQKLAVEHGKSQAVASDAHALSGTGSTFNLITMRPTRENLVENLSRASFVIKRLELAEILTPTKNKLLSLL